MRVEHSFEEMLVSVGVGVYKGNMRSIEQSFDSAGAPRGGLSVGAGTTQHTQRSTDRRRRPGFQDGTRRFPMSSMTIASAPVRPPHARGSALRLTRRGRGVVLAAFLVAALALVVFAFSDAATGSGERGAPVPVRIVQVEAGDTLWSIATRAAPGEDPRDLIDEIEELNGLDGSLRVGSEIAVPLDR